jgi:hypothetical protein
VLKIEEIFKAPDEFSEIQYTPCFDEIKEGFYKTLKNRG